MSKMSVNDAAEYFGISKEAIHNRIRRGSLESIIEDGIKMVILDANAKPVKSRTSTKAKAILGADMYYKLLEEQNSKLSARVEILENETRTLRDQKELMLIQEREKIEQIYKDKDEQLKNILATLSSQFMLNSPKDEDNDDAVEVEIEDFQENTTQTMPIHLKKYLKLHNFSTKKIKKIKAKFAKLAKNDDRITIKKDKYYIDLNKHDYSDLI